MKFYSLVLGGSNDRKDTAQLLIFIRGINDSSEIREELFELGMAEGEKPRRGLRATGVCCHGGNLPVSPRMNRQI